MADDKVAEILCEIIVNEVAEEAKPSTEAMEEKTPETPVTEPITNGSNTPETPKVETPAAEESSKESPETNRPEVKIESEAEQIPVNGLSLDEPKIEVEVDQLEPEPSKPEETTVKTPETVPATEIPVQNEVCVDQLPLIEPTPPPLPANPPPSSVASFAATTMAPELTDASLPNTADITANTAPTTVITDTITKADDTIENKQSDIQNTPSDTVIASSEIYHSAEIVRDQEINNSIMPNTNEDQPSTEKNTNTLEKEETLPAIVCEYSVETANSHSAENLTAVPCDISIETNLDVSNEIADEIPKVAQVDIPIEIPVVILNEIPVGITVETVVDVNESAAELSNETPHILNESPVVIPEVQTFMETKIIQEVVQSDSNIAPLQDPIKICNEISAEPLVDSFKPEREETSPSPIESAVDEDVTAQNDAEDIVTEVHDSSELIFESPTIVVDAEHIDTNSNDTELENLKNKTKDTFENGVENADWNGVDQVIITNGEPTPLTVASTDEDIDETGKGKGASTPEESMPPSLSEANEVLQQGDGSESFPLPPSELCRSESEASPPATPEPITDVPSDIPQEMLKTDIIAEFIPEVPAVPEWNTDMGTTSDVAMEN